MPGCRSARRRARAAPPTHRPAPPKRGGRAGGRGMASRRSCLFSVLDEEEREKVLATAKPPFGPSEPQMLERGGGEYFPAELAKLLLRGDLLDPQAHGGWQAAETRGHQLEEQLPHSQELPFPPSLLESLL